VNNTAGHQDFDRTAFSPEQVKYVKRMLGLQRIGLWQLFGPDCSVAVVDIWCKNGFYKEGILTSLSTLSLPWRKFYSLCALLDNSSKPGVIVSLIQLWLVDSGDFLPTG